MWREVGWRRRDRNDFGGGGRVLDGLHFRSFVFYLASFELLVYLRSKVLIEFADEER